MCSVNFSDIRAQAYTYLGLHGIQEDGDTDALIQECLAKLQEMQHFRYLHKIFTDVPAFLQKPPYTEFLGGCSGVILCATSLGGEVDDYIRYLSRTDMAKSVVAGAAASALIEYLADEHEKTLGENLTYRFCPGYGGSSVEDLKPLFALLQPEKIGITLSANCFMLPEKSMAGIIGIGKRVRKSCENCCMLPHCALRKDGQRCYKE